MFSPMLRTALVLGLMSAVSPFAIDMFLPALPAMGRELNSPVAGTQATITAYFLSFGLAQLVYGPLSDRYGRKPPIYAGLAIFLAGSVGSALAPGIGWLIAARLVQGAGGAALMVIPRAVIRDLHIGHAATRMMAMIMLVISVSPMLAPLAGSGVIAVAGWRGVFWVIAAASVASLALAVFGLRETLAPEARRPVHPRALAANIAHLFGDPVFMGLTFVGGLGMSSFFVFLTSAPFVYTGAFGLTPTGFSLAFAANAIGFFSASQVAGPLGLRIGMPALVLRGTLGFAGFTSLLALIALTGWASFPLVVALLFLANACLGLVIPSTMVMALDGHGGIAGMASSLGGTLQMLAGAAAVALATPFFDGSVVPMAAAIALCGLGALAIALPLLSARRTA